MNFLSSRLRYLCAKINNHKPLKQKKMKELKVLSEGTNFTAVSAGEFGKLNDFELPMGPGVTVKGKVFAGAALKSTGMEMSLQVMAPGQASPFVHAHKTHEELYVIIRGEGEFRVDDSLFAVAEGSLVRVAPAGRRALRNTGATDMVVMCIQYKADSFGDGDTPMGDGVILDGEAFPDGLSR